MLDQRRMIGVLGGLVLAAMLSGCVVDATFYQERGLRRYHELNRPDAAQEDFQRAVDRRPTLWLSQYHLGLIALEKGETLRARRHLEIALTLVQDRAGRAEPIIDALAEAIFREGDYPRLFGLLNQACDQYGTISHFLRRAKYYVKAGDHDNAQIAFRQAIKIAEPDDVEPYLALAGFYEEVGAKDTALVTLRQAYSVRPGDKRVSDAIRRLGEVPGPTIALPPAR